MLVNHHHVDYYNVLAIGKSNYAQNKIGSVQRQCDLNICCCAVGDTSILIIKILRVIVAEVYLGAAVYRFSPSSLIRIYCYLGCCSYTLFVNFLQTFADFSQISKTGAIFFQILNTPYPFFRPITQAVCKFHTYYLQLYIFA